ncbi:hypothetical protein F383_39367 [Gossypium arboreum]|uniref:Uncharacterized protein n=1 Tax=Gossypium arboreum TaxID=29729 RepID=A0A0B0MTA6_GOSAR|nr:hypothetical protein F383_39367 [Gossypium arboreum]
MFIRIGHMEIYVQNSCMK